MYFDFGDAFVLEKTTKICMRFYDFTIQDRFKILLTVTTELLTELLTKVHISMPHTF